MTLAPETLIQSLLSLMVMCAPARFFSFLLQEEDKRKKSTETMTDIAFSSSALADGLKSPEAPMGPALIVEAAMARLTSEF